jgi:hypothetical protein
MKSFTIQVFRNHYYAYQTKDDEMGGACNTHGTHKYIVEFNYLKGGLPLVGGVSIILKKDLLIFENMCCIQLVLCVIQ